MTVFEIAFSLFIMVASTFFGILVNRLIDNRELPKASRSRRMSLQGKWVGNYDQQEITGETREIPIRMNFNFKAFSKRVHGTMWVRDRGEFNFTVEGDFHHDKYVRLLYTPVGASVHVIDFGACFLLLDDNPKKMHGKLVGWGSESKSLISGVVSLERMGG